MPSAERLWAEITNRLARQASAQVARAFLAYAQGSVALEECIGAQATLIASAQRRAVTFNDVLLAAELTERLEREFNAAGISWREGADAQTARLSKALASVFGDDVAYVNAGRTAEQVKQLAAQSIRARLDRLTFAEVADASQWARQEALAVWHEHGVVAGWYRRVSASACSFCRTLAGPGDPAQYVHPVQHRMATHPHCTCSQGWVTEVEPWQKFLGPREQMKTLQQAAGRGVDE